MSNFEGDMEYLYETARVGMNLFTGVQELGTICTLERSVFHLVVDIIHFSVICFVFNL